MDLDVSGCAFDGRSDASPQHPSIAAELAEHLIRYQRPAQALALLQAPGVPPRNWPLFWRPRWYLLVGWALLQCEQPLEATAVLEEGLEVLKHLLHRPGAARRPFLHEWKEWLHYFLGASFCSSDQPAQALFHHRQTLQAFAAGFVRDRELVMLTYKGMGDAYLALGAYAEAISFFILAKRRGQDVLNPHAHGWIEWGLGLAYKYHGELLQAKYAFAQAIDIFERLEARPLVSQLRALLGQVLIWLQRYDEAEPILRQALGAAERTGDPSSRGIALRNLAALHLARGKPENALRSLQHGLDIIQQAQDQQITGQLYLTLARTHEVQHDLPATEAALSAALLALNQTQKYGLRVRAHEHYGKFLASQGRFQEAYEQLLIAPYKTASSLVG